MTSNEDVGLLTHQQRSDSLFVMVRISPDVSHDYLHAFTAEKLGLGQLVPHIPRIHIAENSDYGFEITQLVKDTGSYVASMPYLVAILEKCIDLLGESAVSVR